MGWIPKEIEDYCVLHSSRPSDLAKSLQEYTQNSVHGSQMLIGELEGSLLQFLIRLGKVKRVLELGTFTGYSALVMAEALPEDGKITTVDINPQTTSIAKTYWEKSEHAKKIELMLMPALKALDELNGTTQFDLIFIDADKRNYPTYLEWGLQHLSDHGMIISDNTLWAGKILTSGLDPQTDAIREHNRMAALLEGYKKTLLPIRDGMFLICK
jgi:caffeoyl-CoA O-methyltransferase